MLGIAGLIYFAIVFMESSGTRQIKSLIVYGLLGGIFFFTGISLIRTTHDDTRPPVRSEGLDQRSYTERGRS